MPDQISVSEFIAETTEDYSSLTTSSFTTRLHNCRNTVTLLEEVGGGRCPPRAALRGPRPARRDASLPLLAAAASQWACVDFRAGEEGDVRGLGEPHPHCGTSSSLPRGQVMGRGHRMCSPQLRFPLEARGGERIEQAVDSPKKREVLSLA